MVPTRIVGLALLVLGVILFIIGMNASDSAADQLSRTFTGHFTDRTAYYIIGGAVAAIVGLVLSLNGGHRHHIA